METHDCEHNDNAEVFRDGDSWYVVDGFAADPVKCGPIYFCPFCGAWL